MNKKRNLSNIFSLGFELSKTNFKLRNEGSYLGIFWYLLDPLLLFLILLFLRGFIIEGNSSEYPIYMLIGLIMFNFFRQSTSLSISAITGNAHILKSIKIPMESLVLSKILQSFFSHIFEIFLMIGIMIYFEVPLIGLVFYPIILFIFMIFIQGIGFILAIIGVYIQDLVNVWAVFVRLLWFGTPVFYFIKEGWLYNLNLINPMFYFLNISRDIIINFNFNLLVVINLMLMSFIVFFVGLLFFEKNKNKLLERL